MLIVLIADVEVLKSRWTGAHSVAIPCTRKQITLESAASVEINSVKLEPGVHFVVFMKAGIKYKNIIFALLLDMTAAS